MIIFGWGGGTPKQKGEVAPITCPNCERNVFFQHVSSTKWFRLYFIPLIPYDTKHFLLCPVCTRGAQLERSQLGAVQLMKSHTGQWRSQASGDAAYAAQVEGFWSTVFGVRPSVSAQTAKPLPAPPTHGVSATTQAASSPSNTFGF